MPARETVLTWGPTGSGKTSLLATAARGYHEETGRKVRLVTAESVQSSSQMLDLIEAGIVQVWSLDANKTTPFERLSQSVLGYWPMEPSEPLSPLVPAFSYRFNATCDKCAQKTFDSDKAPTPAEIDKLKCPKCHQALIVKTIRTPDPRNGIDKVGMYLFESLHEFSGMMMDNMADRNAQGKAMGGNDQTGGEVGLRFQDGSMWIGTNAQTHYLTAQGQIKRRVDESKHLPVDYVLWTAVEADDRDKDNKRQGRCFGPKAAGQAATPYVPQWFGPTLSMRLVPKHGTMTADEWRLYMRTYFQSWDALDGKVPNLCNNRIPSHRLDKGMDYVTGKEGAIPDYYLVDKNDKTFFWRVLKTIESRQRGEVKK